MKSGIRQRYSPLLSNTVLEVLARAIRVQNYIKSIQTGKEKINLPLFSDLLMCIYIFFFWKRNHFKNYYNEFGKVARFKTNIHISSVFLYNYNEQSENKIRKIISFTIVSKRIKQE